MAVGDSLKKQETRSLFALIERQTKGRWQELVDRLKMQSNAKASIEALESACSQARVCPHCKSGRLVRKPIHLSAGQRLFSYIVINILGTIRRNSLVLVDEPELSLHPTPEIAFLRMLKAILASYSIRNVAATAGTPCWTACDGLERLPAVARQAFRDEILASGKVK